MQIQRSLIFISGLILAFQNCGSVSSQIVFTQEQDKGAFQESDNGHPYDGKIFLSFGEACPDGTRVRSRIRLQSSQKAELQRLECEEISPQPLDSRQFQLDALDPNVLVYQNHLFENKLVGTKLDLSTVTHEIGFCYMLSFDFGTPADTPTSPYQSYLQIYEDGKALGPAHAVHSDIRTTGLGLFSHWESGISTLRFSASDNSNPLTNGRTYTWEIRTN